MLWTLKKKVMRRSKMEEDMNVLALVKGAERYVFCYYPGEEKAIVRASRKLLDNPELSFTRYDVDCLAKRVCGEF